MQKSSFQSPQSLIKYEKPIAIKHEQLTNINPDPHEGKATLREILNILLPPKKLTKQMNGRKVAFIQYADESKVSRNDADILKEKMQQQLKQRKAKTQPLCPIRQQIFSQAFSQIIRQVVIDFPQRGIMLSRVRNQAYLLIAAYRTLYEESLTFSKHKLVETQNNIIELKNEQMQLIKKQAQLNEKKKYLLSKKIILQQKEQQVRTIFKEKRQHQIHSLELQHEGLQSFLAQIQQLKEQQPQSQKRE